MPGLHNGNICWGNRKSFNVFADVFSDSFPSMDCPPPPAYISASSYYGYQRINTSQPPPPQQETPPPPPQAPEEMDTTEEHQTARKRQGGEYGSQHVKRIRQEISLGPQLLQREPVASHVKSNSFGHCLV